MGTRNEFEYVVIGLGGIGSAAAYWLARRVGRDVLGLEQFELGHDKGASDDHSRIIRLTYHTPAYVALARHAYAAWRELEEEIRESLIVTTGDLLLGPRDSAMPISGYMASMTRENVQFDHLDADEIMHRWPQFRLHDDIHGTFQADGGIVPARRGVLEHARVARHHGATLLENTPVTGLTPLPDGVAVQTPTDTYHCRRVVIAADAWTNRLLAPLGVHIPLTLMEEQVSYFASPHLDEFKPGRFPVWIWADDPNFYGIPVYGEERGVKAAQDMAGREVSLETRSHQPDPATLDRVGTFLRRVLPDAYGPILYSKTCVYTLTPDRDFVIDRLPDYPQITVALGAGHAYKFAGLIGQILSDLAVKGTTSFNIEPFRADRQILGMENPPKNFLLGQRHDLSSPALPAGD